MTTPVALPLAGVRVVDQTSASGNAIGRFLADLGADVLLVEPPAGSAGRAAHPMVDGVSLSFAARNLNKRSVVIDLHDESGRAAMLGLLAGADIWITNPSGGTGSVHGLDLGDVRHRLPQLIVASVTDFGLTGPRSSWVATDWTLLALGGQLSQSGVPGRPPFMPPGDMAEETGAMQAAWGVLLAYWNRLETGVGDLLDISRHEATAQILDPPFGAIGTAAAQSGGLRPRGRVPGVFYPIFPCADGHVRIVVLAQRQWHGMRAWLGEPEPFTDPRYDNAALRFREADVLYPLIAALFRDLTASEIVAEGQRRGVPVAPVLTPTEVLTTEHFAVRGLFNEVTLHPGRVGRVPTGHVLIDGVRAGMRTGPPALGNVAAEAAVSAWEARPAVAATRSTPRLALSGLRVLDLGVIVMGGEMGRLFADQGAEVIKVENRRFPDGARMAGMNPSFAAGHRNKRSFGVDLRSPEGVALFERLVERSDVVLSNFKPGTLESLGLGYDRLRTRNPGVVLVTSSAMGESGPWRDWMGYGPLVRCVSGLASLWCVPGVEAGFGDSTTVYPDHFAARIVATAALAALVARRTTGVGAHIESSQAESIIVALAPQFLRESLDAGSVRPLLRGDADSPWGIYPCAGDDAWCVVTVRDDTDWNALVDVLGAPAWASQPQLANRDGRLAAADLIDEHVTAWTRPQRPLEVATILQHAGIPAAPMQALDDQLLDPQLIARGFFRRFHQPGLPDDVVAENGVCVATNLAVPPAHPAPYYAEHTIEVCRDVVGLTDTEINSLLAQGVIDDISDRNRARRDEHS